MASRLHLGINAVTPVLDTVSRAVDTYGAVRFGVYLKSGAGTTAGAIQLEGSPTGSTGAEPSLTDWVAIGTPLAFGAAGQMQFFGATDGLPHRFIRVRVSTGFTGGAAATKVWVVSTGSQEEFIEST